MIRWSEADLQVMLQRGKHPLKAIDKIIKKGAGVAFKSKWEAAYASKLEQEKRCHMIKAYWYEPFSLWLPGKVRFKPDFMVQMNDPRFVSSVDVSSPTLLEMVEVKGWSRNRRDGITRLKVAAALFPCFVWRMVYRTKGGGWDGEYV